MQCQPLQMGSLTFTFTFIDSFAVIWLSYLFVWRVSQDFVIAVYSFSFIGNKEQLAELRPWLATQAGTVIILVHFW